MEQLGALSSRLSFATDGNQYLTFALGQEEYGLEILKVQEIKGYSAITPIPNTPPYLKGVMNLRGTIIPVLDLRAKFSLAKTEYNRFTVIIVVLVGTKLVGVIVDAVSDVVHIPSADIQAAPDVVAQIETRFIRGMARAGVKPIVLLDIEKVISDGDFAAVGTAH